MIYEFNNIEQFYLSTLNILPKPESNFDLFGPKVQFYFKSNLDEKLTVPSKTFTSNKPLIPENLKTATVILCKLIINGFIINVIIIKFVVFLPQLRYTLI